MEEAKKVLKKYLPKNAVDDVVALLYKEKMLHLKITKARLTKLGDYKRINKYKHQITINYNLNPYQFLITLLHELAHYLAFKIYGKRIKPHGEEWKMIYRSLLLAYIKPDIFPAEIMDDLLKYAQNPKASTAGDGDLYLKLSKYDKKDAHKKSKYVFELTSGQVFALPNGVVYQLQEKRRTRYKCLRLSNKKVYLIHQNAEVFPIKPEDL
jgi:hypothetical protein